MSNLKFAIFNLTPQGTMALAHQTLFDDVEGANQAINEQILPEYDAAQRQAFHNDLKSDSVGQSPNTEELAKIRETIKDPKASITLNTVNLVVLPVNDIVTLNFTVNAKTYAEMEKSPIQPSDAVQADSPAANDAVSESQEDKDAKGVKEEPIATVD